MADLEKNTLNDDTLSQVTGGSINQAFDYLYETKVIKDTKFLDGVPNTQVNVRKWTDLAVGQRVRVISDTVYLDYMQRPYLKCIKKVDTIVEGYILEADLEPHTV